MQMMVLLLYCCVLFLPLAAAEQSPFQRLGKAKSLKCHFGAGRVGVWKNGTLAVKQDTFDVDVHFDNIDYKARQARTIASKGSGEVTVLLTGTGATFVEQTPGGNFVI